VSRTKPNSVRKPRGSSPAQAPRAGEGSPAKQRRCILSRRECSTAHLIRFVAGPDNRIVPDLAERLPGRGLWLSANRAALDEARKNGSFARAARAAVTLEEELAEQVSEQLGARALNYLGLSSRAGAIAIGHDQVRADLSIQRAAVLVQATDGAAPARFVRRVCAICFCANAAVSLAFAPLENRACRRRNGISTSGPHRLNSKTNLRIE